ncbi:hypothetical protein GIB67_031223 [Kingdonia uniflora]|uniref:Myosin motor domain-containing protein n=1 Tax=Kingdonia uniflora TaxID=39325 RepID=A0A7J7NKV0_9MAGN|nr:hypothetical protein GIB67_031223 [Kingdonia uniflora]
MAFGLFLEACHFNKQEFGSINGAATGSNSYRRGRRRLIPDKGESVADLEIQKMLGSLVREASVLDIVEYRPVKDVKLKIKLKVLYHTSGFLEKNRDPVPSDSIHLFSSCSCQLLQLFASNMLNPSRNPVSPLRRLGSTDSQKQSVGTKFKGQLFKLMQQLENSTPHFIRCIKPNSKQLPRLYEKNLALQQLRCCGVLEVVRISRSGYPTRMTHQKFAGRYGFLLLDNVLPQDPLGISVAILQQFNVHPDMYQVGYTKLFFRTGQIAALEDARNRMLQAILIVQKCFRGYQTRRRFLELQSRITTIQTIIRGKNARKEYLLMLKRQSAIILIQKHFKQQNARKTFNGRQHAVIQLQSVIRSWLVRKHFHILQNLEKQKMESKAQKKPDVSIKDLKGAKSENDQVHYSALADLQKRVLKAEAALGQKEQENAILHQNLKQYEIRWSEYEMKMKSMEEMWQKQMTSLQVSLIAAKKGLMGDNVASKLKKPDTSPVPHYYDSDDTTSVDSYTPEGRTPAKLINHTSDGAAGRECNSGHTAISHLVKEFNLRKQIFNDDANFIVNVKSAQSDTIINPEDELRKLKVRFEGWKKEYKGRLRETKATLQRLGITEDKTRKKWWEKRSTRGM